MTELNKPTSYENRVVAFIDILGFSDFVRTNKASTEGFQTIYTALKEIQDEFNNLDDEYSEEAKNYLSVDPQSITASDSIILSRRADEKGGIYYMLSACADAIHTLIRHGFLCRGAVVLGDLFHKENLIFGPAYLQAVESEKTANYPIIKFSENLFKLANQHPGPANSGDWEEDFIKEHCKQMADGSYYLNYFTDYDSRYGPGEGGASIHYENLRKILEQGVANQNPGVFEKYRWAAEQYNLTADQFNLPQIVIPLPPKPNP
ncbi:hypothetical protein [Hymenobacter terrestris]|uniref:Guanylate cyclase domain-containing protein n=1 Tax=Hymenobacter terrestris TaxID=2748310 RepID=A0ABX2Q012_9BACT|nr:hypothetical protein [Hymenobacter terrestris]NVO84278.1 hypothetical protein [Hymenobacter terrestris]